MATVTGGELVVRTLQKAGVEKVFALHGAHIETIFQSCRDAGIAIVDTRHEVAAGHAAEAYARSLNRLGVALVTAGPGFTNLITSLANAYLDHTPVLYLSGAAALRDAETNTLQAGIDQVAIAKPLTKWAHQITVAADIPRLVAQAIRVARSGPTGPVLLDLPMDVLTAELDEKDVRLPATIAIEPAPAPSVEAVDEALNILARAARPVIMAGSGAWLSGCSAELREFVEGSGIPVFSDFQAHGMLPASHPLYGGTFHKMADLSKERPDVVLALGTRFGLFTLGGSDVLVPAKASIIQIDPDPREIGRLRDVDLPMIADCREALRLLNDRLHGRALPDLTAWQNVVKQAKADRRAQFAEALARNTPPIHPFQAVNAIVENLPKRAIVVGDGAESYHWLNEVIRQEDGGSYITHGFLGSVGFGLGLSIGAQAAHPDRRVLLLAGDGAIGFTIAEFDTLVRHNLPVVALIMNNRSWAASQHFQEMVSGKDRVTATRLGGARYDLVAAGFGCHGRHVTKIDELAPALKEAFASGKPACVNVEIDPEPLPPELLLLVRRH
ncbi:MAG TPA: thiamine pyrophosphate-binding protein [Gammaproteobacteria bacterium]